ncbi:MAG: class I SAM-dependent methyltransferase, partial [Myxococcales bacterium]|nr:class I SAM-dependent methyltransferase [Myxococcales bacterium]
DCYLEQVLTPFDRGVDFSLPARLDVHLRRLESAGLARRSVALDLGFGCGDSLACHGGRLGLSIGLDFSSGMIAAAAARPDLSAPRRSTQPAAAERARLVHRRRRGPLPPGEGELLLVRGDMRRLQPLHAGADLVLAINSLTGGSLDYARTMFSQAGACVAPGGQLWAVFPAREAMRHLEDLIARSGRPRPRGLGQVEDHSGVYVDGSGGRQKFWSAEEIDEALAAAGLRRVHRERVPYPWRLVAESGWGHFPRARRLWDWFVIGERAPAGRAMLGP